MVFMYPQRAYGYPRGYFDWGDPFEDDYYDHPAAVRSSNHGPAKRRTDDFVELEDCFELHLDARRVRPSDISVNLDTKTRTLTVAVAPASAFAPPTRLDFQLPDEAATEGVRSALTKDGTLKIIVPKAVRQMDVDVRPRPQQARQPQRPVPQQEHQRSQQQRQTPQQPQAQRTHAQSQSQPQQPPRQEPSKSPEEPKRPQRQPSFKAKTTAEEDEWWKRDQVLEELSPEEAAAALASQLANADSDSEGEFDEDLSDVFDEEDAFRVSVDIRGFSPAEVSVAVDDADGVLTVSGEHEDRSTEGRLIATNSFKRSFVLPAACDATRVSRDDSELSLVKVSVGKK